MSDAYTPLRGKCTWWREKPVDEDLHDLRVPEHEKRVYCSCFIEGKGWSHTRGDVPSDCPEALHCRYYIRAW